jgi:hypothetical protein
MKRIVSAAAAVVLLMLSLASTANGQEIDPKFRADLERLIDITGAGGVGAQMAGVVSGRVVENIRKSQPNVPDRAVAIVTEVVVAEFSKAFAAPEGLRSKLIEIYAKHFTHQDVTALLAFYGSDAGRKLISVTPMLGREGMAAAQQWAAASMPAVAAAVQQRLRAEGFIK